MLKSTRQKNWYHHDAKKPSMKKKFCSVNLLFLNKFHYYSKKLKLSKSPVSFLWLVFLLLFFSLFVWRFPPFLLTARTNIPNHQNTLKFSKWGDTRSDPPPFQTGQVRVEVHMFSYKTAVSERQANKKIYEVSVQQNCEQKTYKINRSA